MSSRSAAIPTGSGAPNASRGRPVVARADRQPGRVDGRVPRVATSRCVSLGASAARADGQPPALIGARSRDLESLGGAPRLVVCGTMDEPARAGGRLDRAPATELGRRRCRPRRSSTGAGWRAARFAPLSPRVAVLIGGRDRVGLLLWMARDSVRPFIVGLLLVYLLDIRRCAGWPPRPAPDAGDPRRLRRRRSSAFIVFLSLTLDAADQRDPPLRRGLPGARRASSTTSSSELSRPATRVSQIPAGAPRLDRQHHRRASAGGGRPGGGSTCPSCCRSSPAPGASSARSSPTSSCRSWCSTC